MSGEARMGVGRAEVYPGRGTGLKRWPSTVRRIGAPGWWGWWGNSVLRIIGFICSFDELQSHCICDNPHKAIGIHRWPARSHFVRSKLLHVFLVHPRPVRTHCVCDNPHKAIGIHRRPVRTHFVRSKLLHVNGIHPRPVRSNRIRDYPHNAIGIHQWPVRTFCTAN